MSSTLARVYGATACYVWPLLGVALGVGAVWLCVVCPQLAG